MKKRELLPEFNLLLNHLSVISSDILKLETVDNEEASKRSVIALLRLRDHITAFIRKIRDVKAEIKTAKGKAPVYKDKIDAILEKDVSTSI